MSAESDQPNINREVQGDGAARDSGQAPDIVVLKSEQSQLVISAQIGLRPRIVYWGPRLKNTSAEELIALSQRQWAFGAEDVVIEPSFLNEMGAGVNAPPGLIVDRNGQDWATILKLVSIEWASEKCVSFVCKDEITSLEATTRFELNPNTHVLVVSTELSNLADEPLSIHWCAAHCMPLDETFDRLVGFEGRWAGEFQTSLIDTFAGGYVRENKSGRTSHDNFPGLIALTASTTEHAGAAVGFHLGWSGNNRIRADQTTDGRAFVQMGELLHPNEIVLKKGQKYSSPRLFAASTQNGLNDLSHQFHQHLMTEVMDKRAVAKARPVHFNTWEAIYFNHSETKLHALADVAAAVGAERFVLDDGWFGGRRSDASGLGDWDVSSDMYPNGLTPFADKVRGLGMEFGLWFEPEMVNPDSDLFRAHPDWVLSAPGVPQVPFRKQYVLDLSRVEVSDYLFDKVSSVVRQLGVAYIKWDMNRVIHHPGSAGRGAIHNQTNAVYALMKRLRDTFPELEIESCASGGGRADFGVLRYTDRIWTSDNNDALQRQHIQRGASYFFPLIVSGAHVGPKTCHITGRTLGMHLRAASAIFGHMGLEVDLTQETAEDIEVLKRAIALYKKNRNLLHFGHHYRLQVPEYLNAMGVVADDQSSALFSCATMAPHRSSRPQRLHFAGLNPLEKYRTRIVWPAENISITRPSIIETSDLLGNGSVFSGEALMAHGIQLPISRPETCIIYHLAAEI